MKTEYVRTGSFWVGSAPSLALEAVLGTCVGVVLYDRPNRVGGLHHILLPDPVYLDQNPERYASTGLPLFIHALCKAGAVPANLKAQIAGGALVGKLKYPDFDLDIGGRTTERALAFLKHARIPVEDSVTGGLGGCRLRLELPAMAVKVSSSMWQAPDRSEVPHPVDRTRIRAAIEGLTPIPQVALRILQNSQDEHYALSDLTQDLEQEQVLSAHTIKLANSALFKRVRKVDSIGGAVALLGRDKIIRWVVQKAIDDLFNINPGGYSLFKGGLFHHARKTARLCEVIAKATGILDPSTAYLAGLMHDIGKVVLDQYIPQVASRFYEELNAPDGDFLDHERRLMGMDHTEAGALLARAWGFPAVFVEAIAEHHTPAADDLRASAAAGLVYLADLLLARFSPGATLSFPKSDHLIEQLRRTRLSDHDLNAVINAIPDSNIARAA